MAKETNAMRLCKNCGIHKPLAEFFVRKNRPCGFTANCKACELARQRTAYGAHLEISRRKSKEKEANRAGRTPYREHNHQKSYARNVVSDAIRRGLLAARPTCEWCGTNVKTQAHHWDYAKPLDVVWLCSYCHRNEHGGSHGVWKPENMDALAQEIAKTLEV